MPTVGVISNPAGINPAGFSSTSESRAFSGVIAEYEAASAVAAFQPITINTSLKVAATATNTARELVVGVAVTDAAAGEIVQVAHLGVTKVKCEASVAAGALLMRSGSTAGTVDTATATADDAEGGFLGVSLTAESGGYLWAFISPSFQRYNEV